MALLNSCLWETHWAIWLELRFLALWALVELCTILLSMKEWNCMRFISISRDPDSWDNNDDMCGFFCFMPKVGLNTWGITILPTFLLSSGSVFWMCIASLASHAIWDFSWSITLNLSMLGEGVDGLWYYNVGIWQSWTLLCCVLLHVHWVTCRSLM